MKFFYVPLGITMIALAGCQTETKNSLQYQVEITRTEFGIPHIKAANYGSLGYGEAYASAQDHV